MAHGVGKRRALPTVLHVQVGAALDELGDDVQVTLRGGQVQRGARVICRRADANAGLSAAHATNDEGPTACDHTVGGVDVAAREQQQLEALQVAGAR